MSVRKQFKNVNKEVQYYLELNKNFSNQINNYLLNYYGNLNEIVVDNAVSNLKSVLNEVKNEVSVNKIKMSSIDIVKGVENNEIEP